MQRCMASVRERKKLRPEFKEQWKLCVREAALIGWSWDRQSCVAISRSLQDISLENSDYAPIRLLP